jgi:hypothetical protein
MKILLLALSLLSPLAPATTIAVGETAAEHDFIYLTDESRACKGPTFYAEIEKYSGKVIPGCWGLFDDKTLLVEWSDGHVSLYPMDGFQKPDPDHQGSRKGV